MNFWRNGLIRLRGLEPEDATQVHEWWQDSEWDQQLDFIRPPLGLTYYRKWAARQAVKGLDEDAFQWVLESADGTAVGLIDTFDCRPRVGVFSYDVSIAAPHRRHGYGMSAVQLVLRYYFEELRYQKVTASVYSFNEPSKQLHERLGFTLEGTLRRMVYTRGGHFDLLWYGLLREEWAEM